MIKRKARKVGRDIRHKRVRKNMRGTLALPRLCVFKSSSHIYAQIINDVAKHTLVAASSLTPGVRELLKNDKKRVDIAKMVGKYLGEVALSKGIKKVCFDRGGYPYHGRIRAIAEGAREAGLEF
jgi:large subunit ribosomal protein L18